MHKMKTKSLIQTNPYLKELEQRQKLNKLSVRSSCGVEGIKEHSDGRVIKIERYEKKLFNQLKAKLASG
jgi:L-2-hydroxyglutarate oxidase LhgO